MIRKIFNLFSKHEHEDFDLQTELPKDEEAKFLLTVDNIRVGNLYCKYGEWYFKYTDEFKTKSDIYNRIIGFPDLDKTYKSVLLWPFFQVRIPGLKQPAIQEILKNEKIDEFNEVQLLKRFGKKIIANPYELVMAG